MGFFTRCDDCEYWNKDKYLSIREGEGGYFARESYRDLEKCWCSVKREYVKSDEAMNCSRYKQKSSGCFLTTACVEYKGLEDDCEELTKLRAFRDNYLKTTEEGKAVVEEYYRIAPQIVEKINASAKKAEIYDYIYKEIHTCIACIESGDADGAVSVYRGMVKAADEMVNA